MRFAAALLASAALLAAAPVHAKPADADAAKQILKDSVAIPTVAGRGKVPELAAYYAKVLKAAGFADSDIDITPIGETATFAATLRGTTRQKPIVLLGHMDVVEADPKDWTRDPFVPVEENGYIFGRGSVDNKFDVAMMVATMAQLKKDGFKPKRSIILLLSGDEETAMVTTRALAAKYKDAEFALNGDGGGGLVGEDGKDKYYGLQAGEKTYADYVLEVTNPGGHSSRPGAVNAIVELSEALAKVGAYRFAPQQNELTKVGNSINQAKNSYDEASKKLVHGRGSVIRQAEMLRDLGIKPTKTLAPALARLGHDEEEEGIENLPSLTSDELAAAEALELEANVEAEQSAERLRPGRRVDPTSKLSRAREIVQAHISTHDPREIKRLLVETLDVSPGVANTYFCQARDAMEATP